MNIEKLCIASITIAIESSADKQITVAPLRSCISGLLSKMVNCLPRKEDDR